MFRKARKDAEQPRSGLDVSALLDARANTKNYKIDPSNAVPEFKQIFGKHGADSIEVLKGAVTELGAIIRGWIKDSFGDQGYDRAIEALGVMRNECLELEIPGPFNDYMHKLKRQILGEELNGDRKEMWYRLKRSRLGLILKRESSQSDVTEEEGRNVSSRNPQTGLRRGPNDLLTGCSSGLPHSKPWQGHSVCRRFCQGQRQPLSSHPDQRN